MTAVLIAIYTAVIISSRNCMSDMGKKLKTKQSIFKQKTPCIGTKQSYFQVENALHWKKLTYSCSFLKEALRWK